MSYGVRDLNEATKRELLQVEQIGQVLADRILAARAARPFRDWSEVKALPQIGPVRLANLQRNFCIGCSAQKQSRAVPERQTKANDRVAQHQSANDWIVVPDSRVSQNAGASTTRQRTNRQLGVQGSKPSMDLNIATKEQLMQAPQIGHAYAEALIEMRPFRSWAEVAKVSGIGEVRLSSLQSMFFLPEKPFIKIDLNTATKEQLMEAPQIGTAYATALTMNQPFGSWEEVGKLSGIGEVRLASLQSRFFLSEVKVDLNSATKEQLMQANQIGLAYATDLMNMRPFSTWCEVANLPGIGKVRLASLQSMFFLPEKSVIEPVCGDSELDCAASAMSASSFVTASSGMSMLSADGPRCFLPQTLLPCSTSGTYQDVNTFKQGDRVLSAGGKLLEITSLKVHEVAIQKCVELWAGDVVNRFTDSHRVSIFRADREQKVRSGTLRSGDDVFMSNGGTQKLSAVNEFMMECQVYEFMFEPDLPVASYPKLPDSILTHGRAVRRSHRRASFKGDPASSIPDTDSEWGYLVSA